MTFSNSQELMRAIAGKPFYKEQPTKLGLKATLWISNAAWVAIVLVLAGFVWTSIQLGSYATEKYLTEKRHLAEIQAENARLMAERDMKIARMATFQSTMPTDIVSLATTIHEILGTSSRQQLHFMEMALPEALRVQVQEGIPASAALAQAIYESGYGNSELAKIHHNYFGMKAFNTWNGERAVNMPTKDSGVRTRADFRSYANAQEGFDGWVSFLKNSDRYSRAFRAGNGEQFIAEILRAGYCPDPDYLTRIKEIMQRHRLGLLDAYHKDMTAKALVAKAHDDPS